MKFLWRIHEPLWLEAALLPLTAASWAYAAASTLRRPRPFRAAVPAISVGNVVAGGAGKTPVALEIARRLLDRVTRPATLRGKRKRALQPLSPADQELFLAALRGEHRLKGFRNRDLARRLYPQETKEKTERRRRCGRVTRLIQLLRAHGLVAKIPRSRRYRVTARGELLMSAAIKVKEIHLPRTMRATA